MSARTSEPANPHTESGGQSRLGAVERESAEIDALLGVSRRAGGATGLNPVPGYDREALTNLGRSRRKVATRRAQAAWSAPVDRPDPVEVLRQSNNGRVEELVPIRIGRMAASPFAYLRGSPAMMATDLADLPTSGILVQACGDAHVSNFGVFGSPERRLVFDVNDFDETLPAPWEWDLKRLAVSAVVAGRENGFAPDEARELAVASGRAYRRLSRELSRHTILDIWYSSIEVERIGKLLDARRKKRVKKMASKARRHDSIQALRKMTEVVDGESRIRDDPPLIVHTPQTDDHRAVEQVIRDYTQTLRGEESQLLSGFRVVDVARKVVGVGSVGTRCFVVLLAGRTDGSPLFLQVKEAVASVLEPFAGRSHAPSHGARVVEGQLLMQAASDPFLGHVAVNGRDFYVRQLRDMKGSIDLAGLTAEGLMIHTQLCAAALARAHARTCHPCLTGGYLGRGVGFDEAIGDFAVAYADQNERDYEALLTAIDKGQIEAEAGL